jgi:hypothetical protein
MAPGTWLPAESTPADLLKVRPVLYGLRERFRATLLQESGLDPDLVVRCERRVHWLLESSADEPHATDERERVTFAYVDAFVRDPRAVTDDHVTALRGFLSVPQVVGLTEMLALLDGFARFRLILSDGAV